MPMPDDVATTVEVADLRSAVESWFEDRCDIFRPSAASDDPYGGRGNAAADTLLASSVHCTIESGAEHVQTRALLAIVANVQAFAVTFPANTDVSVGDHLVLVSKANQRLRVEAVMAPESLELERRVVAIELE